MKCFVSELYSEPNPTDSPKKMKFPQTTDADKCDEITCDKMNNNNNSNNNNNIFLFPYHYDKGWP